MVKTISTELSHRISLMSLLAAVMVVFIHSPHDLLLRGTMEYYVCNFIGEGLCNIAVPFFFTLSGFMIARHTDEVGWWKVAVVKRFRSIFIPYVAWCLILTIFTAGIIVFANLMHHEPLVRNMHVLFPWSFLGLNPMDSPPCPLWYLRTLMIFVLLSPCIDKIIRCSWACFWLTAMFVLDILIITVVNTQYPSLYKFFVIFMSLKGLFYYTLGFWLSRRSMQITCTIACAALFLGLGLTVVKVAKMGGLGGG